MINNTFVRKIKNDIYLSDDDIRILKKYEIPYTNFNTMKELIFEIETILNNIETEEDLEDLSIKLSEYNYHFRTNK